MNENTSLFIENSCNNYVLVVGDSPMTVIVIESDDKKAFKV